MIWGFRGVLKNNDSGENRNPDWYVIHASVCSVSHGCGSVDVWCGVGNYTALSLDHPISRSDNADYRLIKSRLASAPTTPLQCPFSICGTGAVSHRAQWRRRRYPSVAMVAAMQNKATEKVIKRPGAVAEGKMQQQCSANPPQPTCPLVPFLLHTKPPTAEAKQAARSRPRLWSRTVRFAFSFMIHVCDNIAPLCLIRFTPYPSEDGFTELSVWVNL